MNNSAKLEQKSSDPDPYSEPELVTSIKTCVENISKIHSEIYHIKIESNAKIRELEGIVTKLKRLAFDMILRKVVDSGLVYGICKHKNPQSYNGTEAFIKWCNNCSRGLNIHYCQDENENFYFTCDEARVINNVARQYGVEGSINTATKVRD